MDETAIRAPDEAHGAAAGTSCPQCGAGVLVRGEDPFLACGHCRASLYLDLAGFLRHVHLRPRLQSGEARGALERFLRAAEVDAVPAAPALRMEYHPWWIVPGAGGTFLVRGSAEAAFAAAPIGAAEAGDAEPFDVAITRSAEVVHPTLTADDAAEQVEGGRADGARLLHVPVWRIDWQEGGQRHRAYVDAVAGTVSSLALPPRSSRRMDATATLWFAGAAALFALEAAFLPGFLLPAAACALTGFGIVQFVRLGERRRA